MNRRVKPELLAPAGDLERLKMAFLYGADACYIGGFLYGLRANAINFTLEEIKIATTYAHQINKKIYVTVNIVLHNKEIADLINYLKELEKACVDAIIVSDPSVIKLAREHTNLEIHLSTQQSALNYEAINFFKEEGVTRVVLGRETSKEEIAEIINKVPVEIETFIHGAMCASYSGRCVLSNFFTARDANRGGCSQICRWDFDLYDEKHNALKGEQDFTFCTKDLSMLKHIPEMIDLGITSFKIEGRMRSVYYIATIVHIYRKAIDEYYEQGIREYHPEYEQILRSCANRDAVAQFFNHDAGANCQYYNGRLEVSNQDFLGLVLGFNQETKYATIEERNYFKVGDEATIFGPHTKSFTFTITEIIDEEGNQIDIARHPKQILKIKLDREVEKFDIMKIRGSEISGE